MKTDSIIAMFFFMLKMNIEFLIYNLDVFCRTCASSLPCLYFLPGCRICVVRV